MARSVEFADGFTAASEPVISGAPDYSPYPLANNQVVAADVIGLSFNSITELSAFIDYELERVGSSTYRQTGRIVVIYDGSSWSLKFQAFSGDEIIQDSLVNNQDVVFSIVSGQVKFQSGNLAGHVRSTLKALVTKVTI